MDLFGILTTSTDRLGPFPPKEKTVLSSQIQFQGGSAAGEISFGNPAFSPPPGDGGDGGTTDVLGLEAHFGGGPADVAELVDALVSVLSGQQCRGSFKSPPSAIFHSSSKRGYCFCPVLGPMAPLNQISA